MASIRGHFGLFGLAAMAGLWACSPSTATPRDTGPDGDVDVDVDSDVDSDTDVDSDGDGDADVHPGQPGYFSTSGGGVGTSAGHKLRLGVGAPQPMGSGAAGSTRATTGPGATGR